MITHGLETFTDDERFEVARQLCALQLRNPRIIRDQLEPALAEPIPLPASLTLEERKHFRAVEPLLRGVFKSTYDMSKFASHGMQQTAFLDETAEMLAEKQWVLVPYPTDMSIFVTGELPFLATKAFGTPGAEYIFPVTPSLVLILTEDAAVTRDKFDLERPWAFAALNFAMVIKNREVYYRDPAHKPFIEQFLWTADTVPKDPAAGGRAIIQLGHALALSIPSYMSRLGLDKYSLV
jgi:hypothetical protein